VLLPNTSADQAEAICSRIQAAADNSGDRPVRLSISTGCATKYEEDQNILEILREAEDYMYRHKSMNTKSSRSALVTSLQRTLEEKSHETQQHAENMRNLAVALGKKCRITERDSNELALLAILHDLGKVAIPEQILTKTGPLTDEEWQIMRKHPEIGHRIALASPDLVAVADGILSHHERFDGAGYPRGLKGTDIPLSARIVAIVDTFEAMTSDRPYRKGVSVAEALEEIHACAGFQFDPKLVTLFLEMMQESEAASTTEESP